MLSDRSYMHRNPGGNSPGFLAWFLGVLAGVFVLQAVLTQWFGSDMLLRFGALSSSGLRRGEFWTPFTYALLHGSPTHLLLNGLGVFFVGRALQQTLGSVRLAWVTLAGALGGAAAWLAFHFDRPGNVIGASGIAMTYLTVFACLQPWRRMTVLLFFIIPVTIQPVWLVGLFAGIDFLGLLTKELPDGGAFYGVAHSAHLGGLAAGWLFHRLVIAPPKLRSVPTIEPPAWARKASARPTPAYTVDLGGGGNPSGSSARPTASSATRDTASRDALKAEVDRILDKINLHGFGALTEAEKRVLDEARQHLSHR